MTSRPHVPAGAALSALAPTSPGVPAEERQTMRRLEREHWWFRGKREAVAALLARAGVGAPGPRERVLDVGCATGAVLQRFSSGVPLGIDVDGDLLRAARGDGALRVVRADARALPVGSGSVDRLFLLDVAEHVPEHARVFEEVRRVLKPAGVAVVHVPAHPRLWSPHDDAVGHVRRYTRAALAERLREAGLRPVLLTPTFAGALLPAAAVRAWKRSRAGARGERTDFGVTPRWVNGTLAAWQRAEASWLRRRDLPFGLSLAAVVRPL
jgi:SAM-dependent methyltransferase